jgi:hypothetical protein
MAAVAQPDFAQMQSLMNTQYQNSIKMFELQSTHSSRMEEVSALTSIQKGGDDAKKSIARNFQV